MVNYQERFKFYVHRAYNLKDKVDEEALKMELFNESDFNAAAWIIFDMAFTNFQIVNEDWDDVSEKEKDEVFTKKKKKFAIKISDLIADIVTNKMY